jgi:hypothetical protein
VRFNASGERGAHRWQGLDVAHDGGGEGGALRVGARGLRAALRRWARLAGRRLRRVGSCGRPLARASAAAAAAAGVHARARLCRLCSLDRSAAGCNAG